MALLTPKNKSKPKPKFAAMATPLDIKCQYGPTPAESQATFASKVVASEASQKGNMAEVYVEFKDYTYDVWQIDMTLQPNNDWLYWRGWRKTESGDVTDPDSINNLLADGQENRR